MPISGECVMLKSQRFIVSLGPILLLIMMLAAAGPFTNKLKPSVLPAYPGPVTPEQINQNPYPVLHQLHQSVRHTLPPRQSLLISTLIYRKCEFKHSLTNE